jgi:hypothetical protein
MEDLERTEVQAGQLQCLAELPFLKERAIQGDSWMQILSKKPKTF